MPVHPADEILTSSQVVIASVLMHWVDIGLAEEGFFGVIKANFVRDNLYVDAELLWNWFIGVSRLVYRKPVGAAERNIGEGSE